MGDSSLAWSKRHSRPSAPTIAWGEVEMRSADPVMFATTSFARRPDEEEVVVSSRKGSAVEGPPSVARPKPVITAHEKELDSTDLRTIESRIIEVEAAKESEV